MSDQHCFPAQAPNQRAFNELTPRDRLRIFVLAEGSDSSTDESLRAIMEAALLGTLLEEDLKEEIIRGDGVAELFFKAVTDDLYQTAKYLQLFDTNSAAERIQKRTDSITQLQHRLAKMQRMPVVEKCRAVLNMVQETQSLKADSRDTLRMFFQ